MAKIIIKAVFDSSEASSGIAKLKQQINEINRASVNISSDGKGLNDTASALTNINSAAKSLTLTYKTAQSSTDNFTQSTSQSTDALNKMDTAAGKASESITSMIGKFTQWYLIGNLVSGVNRAFQEALDTMQAVDDELVVVSQ